MKIHEYQAKRLFAEIGIPVPEGRLAHTPDEAAQAAQELGPPVAVKAQVLVGGRGKAGGIKLAASVSEAEDRAAEILGMEIKGLPVRSVLVERTADIRSELYLSIALDRASRAPLLLGSAMGGVDIEEVARTRPEAIERVPIDPEFGLRPYTAWAALRRMLGDPDLTRQAVRIAGKLYSLFMDLDSSLVEINPLIVTGEGQVMALDAKVNLDDNALHRHPQLDALRDLDAEDPRERDAKANDLSFVALEGDIGCIVNGAGLAMATMDMVKHAGGRPANFLDVGGSSRPEKVLHAMRIILADPQVRVILLNIFGGITRCDDIAQGLIAARTELGVRVPIVARLTGTNEQEGRALLRSVGLESAETMEEAVRTAVRVAEGGVA
ncbi:MAG: ADP-forming succinate--CoA ligase subunit beta [Armatimonadetes bacterium]|jgi:succinyl-CoA synthetase beta subunit|nr:ADP-forming succinate--CoA ligase subunit beta [Armatimonadota bacterium]